MPKVSVILSAYNAEKYIALSIKSVLTQSYRDFEFLIIDDASTDGTAAIIEDFSKRDSRIRFFSNIKNTCFQGYVNNLNNMIKKAKGYYIAKLDADDIWYPHKLETQIKDAEAHPDIFLLSANAHKIDQTGNITGEVIRPHVPIDSAKMLLKSNPFCHPSILFRNQGYLYRPKMYYTEEYDLYLRMFSDGKKLVHRKELLFQYRILQNSLSRGSKVLIQALFKEKAIHFYHQRVQSGQDNYDQFDPKAYLEILEPGFKNTQEDLRIALKLAFIANLREDFQTLLKKGIKQHGFLSFAKFWLLGRNFALGQFVYQKL